MASDSAQKVEEGTDYYSLSPSPPTLQEAGPSNQKMQTNSSSRLTHDAIQLSSDENSRTFTTVEPPLKGSPSFTPVIPSMRQDLHTFHNGRQAQFLSHQPEVNVKPNPQQFIYSGGQGSSVGQQQNGQRQYIQPKKESSVKEEPAAIDLTKDVDDDVTLVSAKGPSVSMRDPGQVICIGVVCGFITAQHGVPDSLTTPFMPNNLSEVNAHPRWQKNGWPLGAEYYLEAGYRPIELTARAVSSPQVWVHDLKTPFDNNGQPEVRREPFAWVSDKLTSVLFPYLSSRRMRIAARIKVVPRSMASNYAFPIELLCFMARKDVQAFAISLFQYNIPLILPARYDPNQFEFQPPLEFPALLLNRFPGYNQNPYGQFPQQQHLQPYNSAFSMPNRGITMPTKEESEEERRKQMDQVYSSLPDGETLATTKVDETLITTPLMNHQMRALTFLLDHEKNKTFEEDGKDDNIISLWKAKRQNKRIISYNNVVTRESQTRVPKICRGAILADDMGLGKTLTTISLIASTHEEARAWSKKKLLTDDQGEALPKEGDDDDDSDDSDVIAIDIPGAPKRAKTSHTTNGSSNANGKKKKEGKREHKKKELEQMKRDNIKVRTRATLVVLPLTLVSSWEEQIRLHWAPDKRPKVYVHHGHNRLKDAKKIARNNIVMTTYSTLASEYSILATQEEDSDSEDDKDDDEEEVIVTDEHGNAIGRKLTAAEKAAIVKKKNSLNRKRKRKADKRKRLEKGEGFPLQQIEWFRIVLDEAHTIKESRTLQSRAACFLMARSRICLTGTPVQNRIQDLFALVKFLRLEPFDDLVVWNRFCASVDAKIGLDAAKRSKKSTEKEEPLDSTAMKCVQTIMKYLTLRRTKDMKMADGTKILELPPKYSRTVQLEFDPHERATYNEMREQYKDDFEEMKKNDTLKYNYASILHEISNLRMTCDHIELVETNKDIRHRKDDPLNREEDPDALIKREGISRDRALRFFEVLCSSDKAECSMCHHDLSTFADESSRQESPVEDIGVGQGDSHSSNKKPVLTKCAHLLCTHCLERAMNEGGQTMDNIDEETRIACPDCGTAIAALTEIRTLAPGDIEKNTKARNILTKETFGADIGIPIDKRSNYSTKIRALVEELETFSRSNPFSKLYDANKPHLDQVAADATEKEMGYEEVYIAEAGSSTKPIKSVVFSQWTSMLDRVARAVHRAGIKTATLDGRMQRSERSEHLDKFQNDPSVEVFLISLKAGGVGLNLVSACRAYLLEPYWNPATENQGLDRVHRMGQLRPVVTTKYIVSRCIEENMLELQRLKMELAESVGGKRRTLNREQELNILFSDDFSRRRNRDNAEASTSRITAAEESNTESEGGAEGAEGSVKGVGEE